MWFVVSKSERDRQERHMNEQFRKMIAEHADKAERRRQWEAGKCKCCGRNDPLPPWLY